MSLIASCKACHAEPWAWITDVLTKLPHNPDPKTLLPDKWHNDHPQHRWDIADRKKHERTATSHL